MPLGVFDCGAKIKNKKGMPSYSSKKEEKKEETVGQTRLTTTFQHDPPRKRKEK